MSGMRKKNRLNQYLRKDIRRRLDYIIELLLQVIVFILKFTSYSFTHTFQYFHGFVQHNVS